MKKKKQSEEKRHLGISDVIALILCLFVSFGIWLYVMETDSPEYEDDFSSVNVEIVNTAALSSKTNLSVIDGWKTSIEVTVKGRKSVIAEYTSDDIKATVDVGNISSVGRHVLSVSVSLPDGLTLVSLSPSAVPVDVDHVETKTVPVTAKIVSAQYGADIELGDPVVSPHEVTVTGPSAVLAGIEGGEALLNLGEITDSVVIKTPIYLVDGNGDRVDNPYLMMDESSATVTVPVYTKKQVALTCKYVHGFFESDLYTVSLTPSVVTLRGEPSALKDVDEIVLKNIDEKSVTGDSFTEQITVNPPAGTVIVGSGKTATLSIKMSGIATKTFSVQNFELYGSGEYVVKTPKLSVTLRGPVELISALSEEEIVVFASTANIDTEGDMLADATVVLPDKYHGSIYELGKYYITVGKPTLVRDNAAASGDTVGKR